MHFRDALRSPRSLNFAGFVFGACTAIVRQSGVVTRRTQDVTGQRHFIAGLRERQVRLHADDDSTDLGRASIFLDTGALPAYLWQFGFTTSVLQGYLI